MTASRSETVERIRVFLVEDNRALRHVMCDFLNSHSDVLMVGSTESACDCLDQINAGQPHIILLDLHMQAHRALQLIAPLHASLNDAYIIMLSADPDDGTRQAVLSAGADDFVPKSEIVTELMPAIRRLMQSALRPAQVGIPAERANPQAQARSSPCL